MDINEKLREINKISRNDPTFFESPCITYQPSNTVSSRVDDFSQLMLNKKISKNTLKSSNDKHIQNETYDYSSNEKQDMPSNQDSAQISVNPFSSILIKDSLNIYIWYSHHEYQYTSQEQLSLIKQFQIQIQKDMELKSLLPKILNQYNTQKTENDQIYLNSQNLVFKLFMCTDKGTKKLKIHKKEINLDNKTLYYILRKYNQYSFRLEIYQNSEEISSSIENMNDNYIENQIITPKDQKQLNQEEKNNNEQNINNNNKQNNKSKIENKSSILGKLKKKSRLSSTNIKSTKSNEGINPPQNKNQKKSNDNIKSNQKFSEEILSEFTLENKNNNNNDNNKLEVNNNESKNENKSKDNNQNLENQNDVEISQVTYDSLISIRSNSNQLIKLQADQIQSRQIKTKIHNSQQSKTGFFNIFAGCCEHSHDYHGISETQPGITKQNNQQIQIQ